jgi:hypothetical protein
MFWKNANNEPDKPEKLTPWMIGIFGVVVFAIATYINYGSEFFHPRTATDISATTSPKSGE